MRKSNKQTVVATSTAETEYMTLGIAAQECVWIPRTFTFAISANHSPEISLLTDNDGAIKMVKKDARGTRVKHIDIEYDLVQELASKRKLSLKFCPGNYMKEDMFTKPIGTQTFTKVERLVEVSSLKN